MLHQPGTSKIGLSVLSVAYPLAPVGSDSVGGAEQILTLLDGALVAEGHHSTVIACEGSRVEGRLLPAPLPSGEWDEAARAAGRIKTPGDFYLLLPRTLDPVEIGRDVPLPPERPSAFSFVTSTMEDPTVPDGAQDVPLPEPKPAAASTVSTAPKTKPTKGLKPRPKQ